MWWKVHDWKIEIESMEVVKATEYFVTYRYKDWRGKICETRQQRAGKFFQTWEEAKASMENDAQLRIRDAEDALQRARTKLEQIIALTKPA